MTSVLVTGATGFTGGHLARRLLRDGWRVRVLVRTQPAAKRWQTDGAEAVIGDLTDAAAVDRAVAGCEVVFHVAALYRTEGLPERLFQTVNVEGTRHLLDAAQRHGVRRVVHTSTVGVHGHIARRRFVMLGRGETLYHMTYVDDLIDGMLLCARHPSATGQVFIIAGEQAVTLNELVRRIAAALDVPTPTWRLPLWPFQLAAPICQRACRAI